MKSLAELKRRTRTGAIVTVDNLLYPKLSGQRRVVKAQTNGIYLTLPAEHPDASRYTANGSWLQYPKASEVTFEGDTASFTDEANGQPWIRITAPGVAA